MGGEWTGSSLVDDIVLTRERRRNYAEAVCLCEDGSLDFLYVVALGAIAAVVVGESVLKPSDDLHVARC